QEQARDGAVRHPVTGVAGDDVDAVRIAGVAADVREAVRRFQDLARPALDHVPRFGEVLARPAFQRGEVLRLVVVLAGLVVLAADDKPLRAVHAGAGRLQANVVIRVERVPVERPRHGTGGDTESYGIGAIRHLL